MPAQDNERRNNGAKSASLLIALAINGLLMVLLAIWTISSFAPEEVELVVAAAPSQSSNQIDKKEFQQKQKAKPTPASSSQAPPVITSSVANPNATFVVKSETPTDHFGIGTGFGAGAGFGSGSGAGGGSVGFFGSRSSAERVVFIIDVSASLSNPQFDLIKEELTKSLKKLSPNVKYQVIFFSGPAWFAEDEHSGKGQNNRMVKNGGRKYVWNTKGGASRYYIEGEKNLYTSKWRDATKAKISKTLQQVDDIQRSYGTDWRHPLQMALEMKPKPNVVYFLTDGAVGNGQEAVDQTLKLNRRSSPKAKINTIVMMQPRAEDLLGELADKTGGEFTVVKEGGKVERPRGKK